MVAVQQIRSLISVLPLLLRPHPALGLVPLPANATSSSSQVALSPAFTITTAAAVSGKPAVPGPILAAAMERFEGLLFAHGGQDADHANQHSLPQLHYLAISIADGFADSSPQLSGDESYSLQVGAAGGTAKLHATTLQGALHGLQTFAQLCRYDFDTAAVVIDSAPWTVSDSPRFSHRGLMLDCSRHFYPPRAILQLLDAMATVKLNVFHWHLVDSTSFPLVVPGTNLSAGAWQPAQRYSRADVKMVVQAATEKAIRVIPEFDLPAHTAPAWCVGEPTICTESRDAVDPSSSRLYEVIDALLKYAASIFPDQYVHLGGDEVTLAAWTSDTKVAAYLKQKHPGKSLARAAEAEAYGSFMSTLQATAARYNKSVIHWEDVFDWAGPAETCGGVKPTLSVSSSCVAPSTTHWARFAKNHTRARAHTHTTQMLKCSESVLQNATVVQIFRGGFGAGNV